ncbi:MAG: protein kinase [Planctomycetes bacterium]|nr:protein kinase [Planctomycetota bacterium]MBL7041140.1 protein kinase [Pirellulaceae bacterium]
MSIDEHPSHDELFSYLVGTLPENAAETVSQHVDQCTVCQQILQVLDESEDAVVAKLRCRDGEDPFANEPQRLKVLERVKAMFAQGDPAGVDAEGMDTGLPEVPCQWGEFQLLQELDRGGQGAVYKAVQTKLQRTVALKVLRPERMANPEFQARFEREMVAIGQLDHPYIVRPMHAGELDGIAYLVMEYVDGISLSNLVGKLGPLAVADACELVRQAAVGLQYAHEHGLVHRDIKPSNLMLAFGSTRNPVFPKNRVSELADQPKKAVPLSNRDFGDEAPSVKILDLGLSRVNVEQISSTDLTTAGQVMGTPDYVAPDQVLDARHVDIRADVYSLGCTLYKLLAGEAPFEGPEYPDTRRKVLAHIQEPVPPIQERRKEVPAELVHVIDRMLAKEPDDRYATPAEVADVLRPFAEEADLSGCWARAISPPEACSSADGVEMPTDEYRSSAVIDTETGSKSGVPSTKRRSPVRRWLALAAASVLLVALGTVVYLNTGQGQIELRVNEPGYRVILDGEECRIESEAVQITVKIPVSAGQHDLRVTKPGFKPDTYAFRIFRNGKEVISAQLLPIDPKPPVFPAPAPVLWEPGPADNVMMGLAARPAQFPGIQRWQIETVNPRGTVRSVAWSPDGSMLACCSQDAQVRVYEVKSGKLIRLFTGHTCGVSQVAWSPTGRWLASCGDARDVKNKKNFKIRLWDVDAGTPGPVFGGHTQDVRAIAWSPDGKRLASASRDTAIRIWDPAAAAPTASLAISTLPMSLSWAPDERRIAIGGYNGSLWIWDATGDDQDSYTKIQADEPYLGPIAWSPDGRLIATAGGPYVTRIRLWHPDGKEPETIVQTPESWMAAAHSLAWSPDGRTLLGGYTTSRFFTWEVDGKTFKAKSVPENLYVSSVAWSPDGRTVAVGCEAGAIYLWTPDSDEYRLLTGYTPRILAADWGPDGRQLVVGCSDGLLRFWNCDSNLTTSHRVHTGAIRAVAWSPDGQWIASGGDDQHVRLFRPASKKPGPALLGPLHSNRVDKLSWSSDSQTLASGSPDETIRLWNATGAQWMGTLEGDFGEINALAWQPERQTLASASHDRNIRFWHLPEDLKGEMRKPKIYREAEGDHSFGWLSWAADGERLAAGCGGTDTSMIRLLTANAEEGPIFKQGDDTKEYRGVAWRPGREILAVRVDEGFVHLLSAKTGAFLSRLGQGHYPETAPPVWTSDGLHLAAFNGDNTVEVFDIERNQPAWTLAVLPNNQSVVFTSAGNLLNGGAAVKRFFVYIVERPDGRRELMTHNQFQSSIASQYDILEPKKK